MDVQRQIIELGAIPEVANLGVGWWSSHQRAFQESTDPAHRGHGLDLAHLVFFDDALAGQTGDRVSDKSVAEVSTVGVRIVREWCSSMASI